MKKTLNKLDFEKYQYEEEGAQTIRISDTLSSIAFVGNKKGFSNDIQNQLTEIAHIGTKIEKLDDYCCTGCNLLSSVNIPSNVKLIGENAFADCLALTSFSAFGDSFTPLYSIDKNAFSNSGLTSVNLDIRGRNFIKDEEYQGCALRNKNDGPYIGDNAFKDCKDLKNVVFHKATEIGNNMFAGCTSLTSVEFKSEYGECVGANAFEGCTALESIKFPKQWEMISENMFKDCTNLKSVTFSADDQQYFTGIENFAFSGCTNLTHIEIPATITDLRSFTENALNGSALQSIKFNGIDNDTFDNYKTQDEQYQVMNIDDVTQTDFKYGQWYRNKLISMVKYATDNELPVVIKACGTGCNFCHSFDKNTFNKRDFQEWCAKSPYLFLDILYNDNKENNGFDTEDEYHAAYWFLYDGSYHKQWGGKKDIKWNSKSTTFVLLYVFWPNKDGTCKVAYKWRSDGRSDETKTIPQKIDELLKDYQRDSKYNNDGYQPAIYKSFDAWGIQHDCTFISKTGTSYIYSFKDHELRKK